ncbi:hypothetical protein B0H14DRAFT_1236348 [Mycena olivaceomarginata]|nr:hypothetical protein B0H14DRAFT_1236348 [Mycena olivaceomarginata]
MDGIASPQVHDLAPRRALVHGKRREDPKIGVISAVTEGVPGQRHRGGMYLSRHDSRRQETPGHSSGMFHKLEAEQRWLAVHRIVEPNRESSPFKGTFVDPDRPDRDPVVEWLARQREGVWKKRKICDRNHGGQGLLHSVIWFPAFEQGERAEGHSIFSTGACACKD